MQIQTDDPVGNLIEMLENLENQIEAS